MYSSNTHRGFKTVFFGQASTGKSTIIIKLKDNVFCDSTPCTIGVSFVRIHDNNNITYDIWDSAGSHRFLSLMPMYFRGASILIFVFDSTNEDSVLALRNYKKSIEEVNLTENKVKIIVTGNKTDLLEKDANIEEIRERIKDKVVNMGMSHLIYDYVFTSAKSDGGCDKLLYTMNEYSKTITLPVHSPVVKITYNYDEDHQKCYC